MNPGEINILSTLDAESGAFSQGGRGRRLPIRNQLVGVTLTLNGDLGFPVPRDENLQATEGLPVVMNTSLT